MDNEQPEFFDQYFGDKKKKSEEEKKDKKFDPAAEIPPFDSDLSEKIFDDDAISKISKETKEVPEIISTSEPEIIPPSDSQAEDISEDDRYYEKEYQEPISTSPSGDEIYDTESEIGYKQPRLSYKPIFIGVGIIAAIAIIYLVVSNLFLGEPSEEVETRIETPEEKLLREQALQKERHLALINNTNKHFLNYITSFINTDQGNINFSSVLFYDKSVYFEVFASNRDKLAQFNMQLKNNAKIPNYKIESVSTRPGSKGGVFALYDLNASQSIPATSSMADTTISLTPSNWISKVSQQNALKVQSQRQIQTAKENLFSISRMEFIFTGTGKNCHDLINQIATENSNFRVHKLALVPTNQRDIAKSPYRCTLILDFYL